MEVPLILGRRNDRRAPGAGEIGRVYCKRSAWLSLGPDGGETRRFRVGVPLVASATRLPRRENGKKFAGQPVSRVLFRPPSPGPSRTPPLGHGQETVTQRGAEGPGEGGGDGH